MLHYPARIEARRAEYMRKDTVPLEEIRLEGIDSIEDYQAFHERHRIFPAVFEDRIHREIIDVAAGVGVLAKRVMERYSPAGKPPHLICNDSSPSALRILKGMGIETTSFDLDDETIQYPFPNGTFDAIIALATIEHLINTEHFITELRRILKDDGRLYISAPNYVGLLYLLPFLWTGRSFHNPMDENERYEFYAHVRYFTYRTLREVVTSFGFALEAVYLGLPQEGSRYRKLLARSKMAGITYRAFMKLLYTCFSPRWASEPVLCFRKSEKSGEAGKPRKIVL